MMRMSLLVFLLIAGASALDAAATPSEGIVGKWLPIKNITDTHVQDLGRWAVVKHTWVSNDGLRFSKVVSGEMQIIEYGINYQLKVQTLLLNGKDAMNTTKVFEQDSPTSTTRKLLSFGPAN
uniref:Uncharacterized protein n=1 Tax=Avena sativa TaxID=4498 RepID=A0ACD5ZJG8_AVESA